MPSGEEKLANRVGYSFTPLSAVHAGKTSLYGSGALRILLLSVPN